MFLLIKFYTGICLRHNYRVQCLRSFHRVYFSVWSLLRSLLLINSLILKSILHVCPVSCRFLTLDAQDLLIRSGVGHSAGGPGGGPEPPAGPSKTTTGGLWCWNLLSTSYLFTHPGWFAAGVCSPASACRKPLQLHTSVNAAPFSTHPCHQIKWLSSFDSEEPSSHWSSKACCWGNSVACFGSLWCSLWDCRYL